MKPAIALITLSLSLLFPFSLAAEAPADYYQSCENKSGRALLSALHSVVGPHKTVSYDGLWDLYRTSDVRPNGHLWDMYSTKEWIPGQKQCGSYKLVGDCVNREHSFPKSWFNDAKPMYSDAFHLYPTDGKVNGQRSNFPYGECAGGTTLPSNGSVRALGRLGTSTFPGYTGKVFEPVDEYKGDFARSYFYMAAAYNDRIASWSSPMLAGNAYPAFSSWAVNLLLKWHRQDPVSQKELDRNEAVYARQRNRNPFIDHPELVEFIWGNRSSEPWSSTIGAEPEILLPAAGSSVGLGLTAPDVALSRTVAVRTLNADAPLTLSVDGQGYSVAPASIPAASANTPEGASATVSFTGTAPGAYPGTLTVACGKLSVRVSLAAEIVDGLPLLPAENITDEGFDAVWTYVGDERTDGSYLLSVSDRGGTLLSGYPRAVPARAGRFTVTGLAPEAEYTFSLAGQTLVSATRSVTTAEPVPSVEFYFEGDLHFAAEPGVPSPVAELLIETDNVDAPYSVAVASPFQLSLDRTEWSASVTLSPEDDRLYLRVLSELEGDFSTTIVATVGQFRIDDATVSAEIRAPQADFLETFENYASSLGSYDAHEYKGTACLWALDDTGIWPSDRAHSGDYAIRGGRNGKGLLEMKEDRTAGIGMLRFFAHKWNTDETPEFDVQLSTDRGTSWTTLGHLKIDSQEYKEYTLPVNAQGTARIRLRQTAGKRYLIDDLSLTSHTTGLADPEALHNRWDAFAPAKGELKVEAQTEVEISVYALDGRVLADKTKTAPGRPLVLRGLAPDVYIITDGTHPRRTLVK